MVTRAAWLHAARVATLVLGAACGGNDETSAAAAPLPAVRVVDSILPPDEELRRFQDGLDAPVGLTGGERSREALVRRFMARLAARDTADLRGMTLSRAEFAHLVFPGSAYTRPPYRTPPGLVWLQLTHATDKGLRRLLRDDAAVHEYQGHACEEPPVQEGATRLWRQCHVRLVNGAGRSARARLFGVIVEVGGQFKFASLDTDF